MRKWNFLLTLVLLLSLSSCRISTDTPEHNTGKLSIDFVHRFNQDYLEFDTAHYFNSSGNDMIFSELQYFISNVDLHYRDGSVYRIDAWKDIHYIDSDIPSTQRWEVYDSIPAGTVDSVSFTFGIDEARNQSFIFVNPPESLMFWPDILGGGYHYLKLNGKWLTLNQMINPFNFHLGIGQTYDPQGNVTGFIHNDFRVVVKGQAFEIRKNEIATFRLVMDVASWFDTPAPWDLDFWGGEIMQNQAAMQAACENGRDAFTLEVPIR